MHKQIFTIGALFTCFLLSSCWVPENFVANLVIDKSANYEFHYDGILAFAPAVGEIKQHGQLSEKGETEMKKAETYLRTQPGFSKANYIGGGRYQIVYDEKGAVHDSQQMFLGLLTFHINQQSQIIIRGTDITDDGRRQLAVLGINFDGHLKVNTELPIIQHNATSTPILGGLIGSYEWHITPEQAETPYMVIDAGNVFRPTTAVSPSSNQLSSTEAPGTLEEETMKQADADLNRVYKQLMATLNPQQQKALREEERSWIKWRDAEVIRILGVSHGGTAFHIGYLKTMTDLIQKRSETLRNYDRSANVVAEPHLEARYVPPSVTVDYSNIIVGKWQYIKDTTMCFAKDGSCAIEKPGVPENEQPVGKWRIEGNQLYIGFDGHPSEPTTIVALSNDELALERKGDVVKCPRVKECSAPVKSDTSTSLGLVDVGTGNPLAPDVTKVIVLVHGYQPSPTADAYSEGDWKALKDALVAALKSTDWHLAVYHWEGKAATGPLWDRGFQHPSEASTIADQLGTGIGVDLSRLPHLEAVQFISHSAGVWAVRSATKNLLDNTTAPRIQVTLLDPFIPGVVEHQHAGLMDKIVNYIRPGAPTLNKQAIDELAKAPNSRLVKLENYYTRDLGMDPSAQPDKVINPEIGARIQGQKPANLPAPQAPSGITAVLFDWRTADTQIDLSKAVEYISPGNMADSTVSSILTEKMPMPLISHGTAIAIYTQSVKGSGPLSGSHVPPIGWAASLFNLGSTDNTPPQLLSLWDKCRYSKSKQIVTNGTNPRYLTGDFDGDGLTDYAVWIAPKEDYKDFPTDAIVLRGNGTANSLNEDVGKNHPGDEWSVIKSGTPINNVPELNSDPLPHPAGDSILLVRTESSAAVLYWNGKRLALYWQGD